MHDKKNLSCAQGLEAAAILFELNTEPEQFLLLAREAGMLPPPPEENPALARVLCLHWYGFVHAAVVAGLMVHAPNIVVASYLRNTRFLLKGRGLDDEACETFVDAIFTPYMELLAREKQNECPALFFRHTCGAQRMEDVPARAAALVSGAMALTLGAIFDKLEQYEILSE